MAKAPAKYENSKSDKKADKAGAKKMAKAPPAKSGKGR